MSQGPDDRYQSASEMSVDSDRIGGDEHDADPRGRGCSTATTPRRDGIGHEPGPAPTAGDSDTWRLTPRPGAMGGSCNNKNKNPPPNPPNPWGADPLPDGSGLLLGGWSQVAARPADLLSNVPRSVPPPALWMAPHGGQVARQESVGGRTSSLRPARASRATRKRPGSPSPAISRTRAPRPRKPTYSWHDPLRRHGRRAAGFSRPRSRGGTPPGREPRMSWCDSFQAATKALDGDRRANQGV